MSYASQYGYTCREESLIHKYWFSKLLNPDKHIKYYKNNKESVNAKRKIFYEKNKTRIRTQHAKYRRENIDKVRAHDRHRNDQITATDERVKVIRLAAKKYRSSNKGIAYKRAYDEIQKIRISSTGKTYKQLFSELKNKYEQEFKINPPNQRKRKIKHID